MASLPADLDLLDPIVDTRDQFWYFFHKFTQNAQYYKKFRNHLESQTYPQSRGLGWALHLPHK